MDNPAGCEAAAGLTGVISHVGVDRQSADVVRVDHVGVPLLAVVDIMEDVVQRLRRQVFADDSHLRWRKRKADDQPDMEEEDELHPSLENM